ncbi:nucleotidyltransferase family protein [Acuticoccus sp. I52.16.1]|uniref:nucleotidyltransferase family protein n=1 Tax=Acuticoccus sp. I52.16.1 TaxID=2928472 RepID=UPI001FD20F27|nr:nucleotidyltransferase family protein [Acuticoccus sp. I52.16.1]UOM35943.1 nucleotidyltransferase family protein [Acuticoccus sp. I52.16.1]
MSGLSAMIFAAGRGTRMRPLTAITPKPLIEVFGKAMIDHVFTRLDDAGVKRYVVNVHYLADMIEVHVRRHAPGAVTISDERKRLLDTGGGLVKALPQLGSDPFIVANSDTFWLEGASPTLKRVIEAFDPERMDAMLVLAPTVTAVGYDGRGDFELGTDGRLTRRRQYTVAPFVYAGCAMISPAALADPPGEVFSLNAIFDRSIANGRLFGVRLDGLWLHVGTPRAIVDAERAIRASAA